MIRKTPAAQSVIGVSEKAQDRSDLRRKKIETYNLVRFGLAVLGAMLGIGALGLCVESGPRSRRGGDGSNCEG